MAVNNGDWVQLDTRGISGKGLLKIPSVDFSRIRFLVVYLDVIRYAANRYSNKNYNPERGRHCTLVFLKDDYVVDVKVMEFAQQSFTWELDYSAQLLNALTCSYQGTLESVRNLGVSLGVPEIVLVNELKQYRTVPLGWDTCKVVCEADTAVQVDLWAKELFFCEEEKNPSDFPYPPDRPPPPPPVPPGTPLNQPGDLSPAYDGEDDGGDTEFFPGDRAVPPPATGEVPNCSLFQVVFQVTFSNGTIQNSSASAFFAPIYDDFEINKEGNFWRVKIRCRGFQGEPCQTTDVYRQVLASVPQVVKAKLISVNRLG